MSIEDLKAEIKCWQEIFADPDNPKWSWSGSLYPSIYGGKMALCKQCGKSEYDATPPKGPLGEHLQKAVSKSNPKFHAALKKMAEIHDRKSEDYASDKNRYSNFEEAAATAGVAVDDVFAVLIGVKLARLRELLKSNKVPNNESIQDTRVDLAVYATLWLSYHESA